jgi:hypothetical protein
MMPMTHEEQLRVVQSAYSFLEKYLAGLNGSVVSSAFLYPGYSPKAVFESAASLLPPPFDSQLTFFASALYLAASSVSKRPPGLSADVFDALVNGDLLLQQCAAQLTLSQNSNAAAFAIILRVWAEKYRQALYWQSNSDLCGQSGKVD